MTHGQMTLGAGFDAAARYHAAAQKKSVSSPKLALKATIADAAAMAAIEQLVAQKFNED